MKSEYKTELARDELKREWVVYVYRLSGTGWRLIGEGRVADGDMPRGGKPGYHAAQLIAQKEASIRAADKRADAKERIEFYQASEEAGSF